MAPFAPFSSVGPAAIRAQGVQGGGGQAARGRGRGRGRGRAKSTTTPQPRCAHCNGLIQHKRRDPKHVECRICDGFFHNKCVKRTFGAGTFVCYRCNPDGEQPQPAVPAARLRSLPRGPLQDPAPALAPALAPAQPDDALHSEVGLVVCVPPGDTLASVTTDSTPVSVSVPASGLMYDADITLEQLLIEAEGPTKPAELDLPDPGPALAPAPGPSRPDDVLLPSYLDNMPQMDLKLDSCGFQRSPSQLNTPAAGNCGPEGELLFYLDLGVWIREREPRHRYHCTLGHLNV